MTNYRVNVSSIQDFMQCRFRWLCRWVENRVPRDDARPLRFGKLLHKVYEYHLRNGLTINDALVKARDEWKLLATEAQVDTPDWQIARDALDDLQQMWEPMLLWKDKYPFSIATLEAEEPFEMVHPMDEKITMIGRPDRVGVYQGRIYHVQNRSLASGVNFPLYLELQQRSYHEHLYGHFLATKYPQYGYGGTFFNLYRKLKYRKKPTKKQLEAAEAAGAPIESAGDILNPISSLFWQHPMGIDLKSPLHTHVMASIRDHVREMEATEQAYKIRGVVPPPNEKLNGGPYGNSLDLYYRVLTGAIELSDDTYFKDREDTYTEVEVGNAD